MAVVKEVISHSTFGHKNSAFEVIQLAFFAERGLRVLIYGLEPGII